VGLRTTLSVQDFDGEAALGKNAGALAEFRDGGVPLAALRHRHLQQILGPSGREWRKHRHGNNNRRKRYCNVACHHDVLPDPDFLLRSTATLAHFATKCVPIPMDTFE